MSRTQAPTLYVARRSLVLMLLVGAVGLLAWRAFDLQILRRNFLTDQGDARYLRVVPMPAHRGAIYDRNGETLALSTPVDSVWVDPGELLADPAALTRVAHRLGLPPKGVRRLLTSHRDREFLYLKRQIPPGLAAEVMALHAPGVFLQREYRRYYPAGEVTAHVLGFTDVDDRGQEGLELAYDSWLKGTPGAERAIQDRLGHIVEDVESIRVPQPGHKLTLSLDRRIQYLAYRELKATVQQHRARAGTMVVLDVATGEVLAMVNQPSYNPNNRSDLNPSHTRNRAVTDLFEPGSTMKPFTIAAALESGRYQPDTPINTAPGWNKVDGRVIHDARNFGLIDVARVIQKSSNVGASKIALSLPAKKLWSVYSRFGFGSLVNCGFPGEVAGTLAPYQTWRPIEQATMAYGYGISTTALQLAQAYAAIAGGGLLRPVSLLRVDRPPVGRRVLSPTIARELIAMLEGVVSPEGTAPRAAIPGYHVAGKTGTVHRLVNGSYAPDQYDALFVGMVPASHPRLVGAVVIDDPRGDQYYGGEVAAPVFARVMAGALRLLDIAPDDLPALQMHVAQGEAER